MTPKKRGYLVTDSASREPPLKRSKSPTSKGLASSIQQPGSLDNRSKRSDRHSDSTCHVSKHPTTPTRPGSSSRNASESTLCEESAEGDTEVATLPKVEDVSTGARFGRPAVVDVIGQRSRKARIQGAKEQIAGLCQEILGDPENSVRSTMLSMGKVPNPCDASLVC